MRKALLLCLSLLAGGHALAGEVTVSAAASLTNAFKEIGQAYERSHPGSKVNLNLGASGSLLQQIVHGAPVDIFASADQESMDLAEKQEVLVKETRKNFVRNTLVLIEPAKSAHPLMSLADLSKPEVKRIAVGKAATVPVGRYAQKALETAKLWDAVAPKVIPGDHVRQILDYVARGEVDAGFVYQTDAAVMSEKVRVVSKVETAIPVTYPVALIKNAPNTQEGRSFLNYLSSTEAQAILARYGFEKP